MGGPSNVLSKKENESKEFQEKVDAATKVLIEDYGVADLAGIFAYAVLRSAEKTERKNITDILEVDTSESNQMENREGN